MGEVVWSLEELVENSVPTIFRCGNGGVYNFYKIKKKLKREERIKRIGE